MTGEEAINHLKTVAKSAIDSGYDSAVVDAVGMAAKALEQEHCEDAISRQIISDYVESHIQEINTGYGDLNEHTNRILRMIVEYIDKLPPVTPQPKTGQWIASDISKEKYVCSECGGACWYYDHEGDVAKSRYCPNCGAKMVEPQESKEKTCDGCINAKECVMYEPGMKRCKDYKAGSEGEECS